MNITKIYQDVKNYLYEKDILPFFYVSRKQPSLEEMREGMKKVPFETMNLPRGFAETVQEILDDKGPNDLEQILKT